MIEYLLLLGFAWAVAIALVCFAYAFGWFGFEVRDDES